MNDQDLRQLASLSLQNGKVNPKIAEFVLKKLHKKDLKRYLVYLKEAIKQENIYVKSSEPLSQDFVKQLSVLFDNKTVHTEIDEALGAGFVVQYEDNIIDLSVKNTITQTVSKLKEEL